MVKILSFVFAITGLGFIALGLDFIRGAISLNIPFLDKFPSFVFLIIGLVCLAVAVFLARGKQIQAQLSEVPIFQGNQVVGYRRHGKK